MKINLWYYMSDEKYEEIYIIVLGLVNKFV